MSRLSHYAAALAVCTAVIASSGASAAISHHNAAPLAGAHNGPAAAHNGSSEMDMRQQ
jgi:hypothetical protein